MTRRRPMPFPGAARRARIRRIKREAARLGVTLDDEQARRASREMRRRSGVWPIVATIVVLAVLIGGWIVAFENFTRLGGWFGLLLIALVVILPIAAFAFAGAWLMRIRERPILRRVLREELGADLCPACGYRLHGSTRCPECAWTPAPPR